jgi:hypothetical protein
MSFVTTIHIGFIEGHASDAQRLIQGTLIRKPLREGVFRLELDNRDQFLCGGW